MDGNFHDAHESNPWPDLTQRYEAARKAQLGSQLHNAELTSAVRTELENAFAAGALWQHGRGNCFCHDNVLVQS